MNEITQEDWDEMLASFPEVERPDHIDEETWNGLCAASKYHTATCPPFETFSVEVEEPAPPAEKPYEWFSLPGGTVLNPATRRARCKAHGKTMKWAMRLDRNYPDTVNKHTRAYHAHPVMYRGLPIQVWKCPETGCEVEAVK